MASFGTRAAILITGTLVVQACSAVSCGLTGDPIPGGFPPTEPIANAMQVRMTEPGFANVSSRLCSALGPVLADIPIPPSTAMASGFTFELCPDPAVRCSLHLECLSGTVGPVAPSGVAVSLSLRGTSRVDGSTAAWPVRVTGALSGSCTLNVASAPRTFSVPFDVLRNTHTFRLGYAYVEPGVASLSPLEGSDFRIGGSAFVCSLASAAAPLVGPTFVSQLNPILNANLRSLVDAQQCQRPDPILGCPTGTFASLCTPYCHYGRDPSCGCSSTEPPPPCPGQVSDCVPLLIGPERQGDLGLILAEGNTRGAFGQLIAAGHGPGLVSDGGMSLYFTSGVRATDDQFATPPGYHHACVPARFPASRPIIPNGVDALGNVIPGSTLVPDVGVALSEDAFGYVMYGVYNSGALCLDFDGTEVPQLRTGLLSVLRTELASLIRPETSAPLRLALRPTQVPTLRFSDDSSMPHIRTTIPELQIDVEVFDSERYVRIFTYIADFELPLDVEAGVSTFHFSGEPISVSSSFIGNSEILGLASTTDLQAAMDAAAPIVGGLLTSILPEITLPSYGSLGAVPIARVVTSDRPRADMTSSRYISIFGAISTGTPLTSEVETTLDAALVDAIDPRAGTLDGFAEATTPEMLVTIDAPEETGDVEVSYRMDGAAWSLWSTERETIVPSRLLLLQARHVIEARARRVGEPLTADSTPAAVELVVDLTPPELDRSAVSGGFEVHATDLITDAAHLRHRVAGTTAWLPGPPDAVYAPDDLVEVVDEVGNVGRVGAWRLATPPSATIGDGLAPGARGCGVGGTAPSAVVWLSLALVACLVRWRRRAA